MEVFTIDGPEAVIYHLPRRLDATCWPEDFANDNWRYGASIHHIRSLANFLRHGYDGRARQRLIDRLSQFRILFRDKR